MKILIDMNLSPDWVREFKVYQIEEFIGHIQISFDIDFIINLYQSYACKITPLQLTLPAPVIPKAWATISKHQTADN